MVVQMNNCGEVSEKRWLLPPPSKALRAPWAVIPL
jgi:hypothetical protein